MKTAMAFCVLLTGVCAAVLFRRDPAETANVTPVPPDRVVASITRTAQPETPANPPSPTASELAIRPSSGGPRPIARPSIVTPSRRLEPPPSLSPQYPITASMARRDHAGPASVPENFGMQNASNTHRIVDGDTLTSLAERYLGSAARANEIFAANRDVLDDPGLLPIGVELRLPPCGPAPRNAPAAKDVKSPLVPLFYGR